MTELFHFTHHNNLRSIAASGLLCERRVTREVKDHTVVGDRGIRCRRRDQRVPLGPGGTVADYVPFYFAPRSPMLHRVHTGKVPGYMGGQEPIVYLVTDQASVTQVGSSYVVSDRNAAVKGALFFQDLQSAYGSIDWALMGRDGPFTGRRLEKRMAELLVHMSLPFSAIRRVGIFSESSRMMVRSQLVMVDDPPPIEVHREWYF